MRAAAARQRVHRLECAGGHVDNGHGDEAKRERGNGIWLDALGPTASGGAGQDWSKSADVTAASFCSTRTIQLPELSRQTASIP